MYSNMTEAQLRQEKKRLEAEMMKREAGIEEKGLNGLYYHNIGTGEAHALGKGKIILTVEIDGDCFSIRNYFDGQANESYRSTSEKQAIIDMLSLMSGFRPPRDLRRRDIPSH